MAEKKITVRTAGFTTLLGVAFIVLKLCKVINWSWWWVLAPIWMPIAVLVIGFIVWCIVIIIFNHCKK